MPDRENFMGCGERNEGVDDRPVVTKFERGSKIYKVRINPLISIGVCRPTGSGIRAHSIYINREFRREISSESEKGPLSGSPWKKKVYMGYDKMG
jgi:hypothetical protein